MKRFNIYTTDKVYVGAIETSSMSEAQEKFPDHVLEEDKFEPVMIHKGITVKASVVAGMLLLILLVIVALQVLILTKESQVLDPPVVETNIEAPPA